MLLLWMQSSRALNVAVQGLSLAAAKHTSAPSSQVKCIVPSSGNQGETFSSRSKKLCDCCCSILMIQKAKSIWLVPFLPLLFLFYFSWVFLLFLSFLICIFLSFSPRKFSPHLYLFWVLFFFFVCVCCPPLNPHTLRESLFECHLYWSGWSKVKQSSEGEVRINDRKDRRHRN